MSSARELSELSAEQGLTFLEHLAHNLTIAVRTAAAYRRPTGPLSDQECHMAMYWINEALHNVVQLTRDLRLGREEWDAESISRWVDLWLGYKHAGKFNLEAVERSIDETLHPFKESADHD